MSVALDVYPEIIMPFQGLLFAVKNPTNSTLDITIWLYADSTPIASIVVSEVKSGETRNFVVTFETLGLQEYIGRTITAFAEIPPLTAFQIPRPEVYLLGTNMKPSTRGNAVALRISSSVRLSVVDNTGNKVPYAKVNLYDQQTMKIYSYTAGSDGTVVIPERVTGEYGRWVLEVVKYDPDRQIVCYGLVNDFNFQQQEVKCTWARQVYVELHLNAVKTDPQWLENLKSVVSWLTKPVQDFVKWLAPKLGWESETINAVMVQVIHEIINKNGGNVVLVKQDGDKLKIGFIVGYGSPIAFAAVLPIIASIIKYLIAFGIAFIVSQIVMQFSPVKVAEVQKELAEQQAKIVERLKEAYNSGAISKDTYEAALKNYSEAYKVMNQNLPSYVISPTALITLITIILILIFVISMIKTVRGDHIR